LIIINAPATAGAFFISPIPQLQDGPANAGTVHHLKELLFSPKVFETTCRLTFHNYWRTAILIKLANHFLHNEREILQRLSHHDSEAFTQIYLHYWQRLFALAFRKLESRQCSEDVVQEVFAGLWNRGNQVDIQSLEAYLSAATKYAILKQIARRSKHAVEDLSAQLTLTGRSDSDTVFIEKMLRTEMNRLPEKCKIVFQYSRVHGLSNKEIAGKLNISEKGVEKHISKAIRRLRDYVKN
jgi:RNA polymerase sigma-70 factor (family 1)